MGDRNRVGIGLSYRPARIHWLAEFIPWNRFLGSINFKNTGSEVLICLLSFQLFFFVANSMVTTSAKEFPCHKQQQVSSQQQQVPSQQRQVPSQQQQLPRRRPPPGFLREPELRAYCGQQMSTTAMLPKVAFASGWRRQQRHCRPRASEETIWERLPRLVIYFFECSAWTN